jgi:hypothetical protein
MWSEATRIEQFKSTVDLWRLLSLSVIFSDMNTLNSIEFSIASIRFSLSRIKWGSLSELVTYCMWAASREWRRRTTSRWIQRFIEYVLQGIYSISSMFFKGNSVHFLTYQESQFNADYSEQLRDESIMWLIHNEV